MVCYPSVSKEADRLFFFSLPMSILQEGYEVCAGVMFLSVVMKAIETLQYCSMMHLCTCFQYPSMCLQNHDVKVKWQCGKSHLSSYDRCVVEIVLQNFCSTAVNCVTQITLPLVRCVFHGDVFVVKIPVCNDVQI